MKPRPASPAGSDHGLKVHPAVLLTQQYTGISRWSYRPSSTLLELSDIAAESFLPLAAGAFIGEHSFSTAETPLAPGRPDARDISSGRAFGARIKGRLEQLTSIADATPVTVPGNFTYRKRVRLFKALLRPRSSCAPNVVNALLYVQQEPLTRTTQFRRTARSASSAAPASRACPENARFTQDAEVRAITDRLLRTCLERREPETFL